MKLKRGLVYETNLKPVMDYYLRNHITKEVSWDLYLNLFKMFKYL